jgi:putative multiple sugar transport system substrate-binding protein
MPVLEPYIASGQLVVKSGETNFKKITTENWDGVIAAKRINGLLDKYYTKAKVDAVLSPNDTIALEVIKAFTAAGYGSEAKPLPLISGQDAELNAVKSIIAGEQTGTIYKDTRELAKVAVQMGNALLTGSTPIINDTTTYNNGEKFVSTYLLSPVTVNKANYQTILVDGGYYTEADLG